MNHAVFVWTYAKESSADCAPLELAMSQSEITTQQTIMKYVGIY